MNINELQRIVLQLTASMEGNAWHGPAVFELLNDINDEEASQRPLRDAHNIFEITAHIITWQKAGIRRIGGDTASISEKEDWPFSNDTTIDQWESTLLELKTVYYNLKKEIMNFPIDRLDEIPAGLNHNYYTLFHGIIQHNIYHAGQIAILKKAIRTSYI